MKYLALFITLSVFCAVGCVSEETSITEDLVEDTPVTPRTHLCYSTSSTASNCDPILPLGLFDFHFDLDPFTGLCDITIEVDPSVGQGEYCIVSSQGFMQNAALPTGLSTTGPLTITFTLNSPADFIFNVEAPNLGPDCVGGYFTGC